MSNRASRFRSLRQFGGALLLAAGLLVAPVVEASIVAGSQIQLVGTALVDAAGNVTPRDGVTAAPPGPTAGIEIASGGNLGSFAGYNIPNPAGPYFAAWQSLAAAGPFPILNFIALPAVTLPDGPAIAATFFDLNQWQFQIVTLGGATFFLGSGFGVIHDGAGNALANASFTFSTQAFTPGVNAFSATIVTSVIPLPATAWMFGAGLLLMTAAVRRRATR